MSKHLIGRFNPSQVISCVWFLVAASTVCLWPPNALAQTACQPPGVPYSYIVSGQVTDESGRPLPGVAIYTSSPLFVTASTYVATPDANGKWSFTVSGCTLSPPRCSTGFNAQAIPVSSGYFFSPATGEVCPNNVINFMAKAAPFITVSAANYKNLLAPGAIATAFATAASVLATDTASATGLPLPGSLAGTTVTINRLASSKKAQLYYVSPTQVNYYLPPDVGEGPAEIVIQTANGLTLRSSALITRIAPGVFAANSTGEGVAAAVAQRVKPDNTSNYEPVAAFNPALGKFEPLPIDLGPDTDQVYLALFGTGIRNRLSLSDVTAKIGGVEAQVVYAGPQPQFEGLDQVNILLPRSLAGRGEVEVALSVEGQQANTVTVAIK